MTRVQNKSLFTGQLNEMDLPVTPEQLRRRQDGESALVVMPNLTHNQLEFLTSDMTHYERQVQD